MQKSERRSSQLLSTLRPHIHIHSPSLYTHVMAADAASPLEVPVAALLSSRLAPWVLYLSLPYCACLRNSCAALSLTHSSHHQHFSFSVFPSFFPRDFHFAYCVPWLLSPSLFLSRESDSLTGKGKRDREREREALRWGGSWEE